MRTTGEKSKKWILESQEKKTFLDLRTIYFLES